MAKKKRMESTAEFRRWYEERYGETDRKLLERIPYLERKSAERRAEGGAQGDAA